ncbi:MAG: aminotransferase class I/II-fold pyridoxal phosphate-dependent enzyme [Anaerolineales bacterium]
MDLFEKCDQYTVAREAEEGGYYPYFIALSGSEGAQASYRGRPLIMCGSNNYLGLTTHPKVKQASAEAIETYGTSCTGSRFLNGTLELHEDLERRLADWVGKEAALVFSTGMQTNLGVISALVGRGDIVILDKEDHASIVDGARLGYGNTRRYRHNDMDDLERVLSGIPDGKGKLVVVDGLFSMGGDLANLPRITELCQEFGARLMVDDAHAMGVLGEGHGTAAHFGLTEEVDLIMSTFSKSFASIGGFIAGDGPIVHYIKHHARSLIFSASLPPANTAAVLAALDVMQEEPERVQRVNEVADQIRRGFQGLGFDTGLSVTPIIPIMIGDTMRTIGMWKGLFDAGVFVNPVLSPAVPDGQELLRTSFMATHTDEQLEQVLSAFEIVGRNLAVI